MSEWQRRFWATAASGYLSIVLRTLTGLVMFRLMFETFSETEFGFWALLWSVFGYGILLDFGFGFTAQKAVATNSAAGNQTTLNSLLATIFWTFIGLAVILLATFILLKAPLLDRMGVPDASRASFESAYIVFFVGMAVMFPLGVFPEIMRGLQRVDIANWTNILSTALNFGFLYWGLHAGWSLASLMAVSVTTTALPNLITAVIAFCKLPGLSFAPKYFSWSHLKSQMGFSIAAYLITFSNLILGKSDQMVISMTIGVALVAVYQAGYKIGEMLGMFSTQLQQLLAPAAAAMHAKGDREGLRQLLLTNSKFTFFMVTPCYLLAAAYLEPLIRLLTGYDQVPRATYWVGQSLLLATYFSQLTSACSKRILVMCGQERRLLRISLVEAGLNLGISLALVWKLGILGVAIGTLIPTTLIGWLWVIPFTLHHLEIRWSLFLRTHLSGTLRPLAAFAFVLGSLIFVAPATADTGLVGLAWRGMLCMIPIGLLGRNLLREITHRP